MDCNDVKGPLKSGADQVEAAVSTGGWLRRLALEQFRNYERAEITFQPGLTVLLGPNGQGKTNILEAVHYLAFLRSFRTRQIKELVRFGADGFQLQAKLDSGTARHVGDQLAVSFGRERRLFRNRAPMDKASEFINQFFCVVFVPEDIELIRGPAADRRRFLDMLTGQLDRAYLRDLQAYNLALKSRNIILKQFRQFDEGSIAAYDQLLARHGAAVIMKRRQTVALLTACSGTDSTCMVNGQLDYEYLPGLPKDYCLQTSDCQGAYLEMLAQNRARDMRDRVTTWGPHRDDLLVNLNGHALAAYGSEGQCRASALWLRLAATRLLREQAVEPGTALVLLVDDVLGELDETRRAAFWDQIQGATQILFTCTAIPPSLAGKVTQCLHVADGAVVPE